jgi:site-specific recombinase XerD
VTVAVQQAAEIVWDVKPSAAEYERLVEWMRLRDEWLAAPKGAGRTTSDHTRRAYETATRQWLDNLQAMPGGPVFPWAATAAHVRVWQRWLKLQRLSDSTINARLAAVSSWYSFILADAPGQLDANPFAASTVRRSRVRPYGRAHPLGPDRLRALFVYTESRRHTLAGARNHALLLTYFLTGCRVSEVVRMRWGDLRPSRSHAGEWVFAWRGKGNKRETSPLPQRAYAAIFHYGRMVGPHMPPEASVWRPVSDHGRRNLQAGPRIREHISTQNANRILQQSLRRAGVDDWPRYRIHDLRHSFAHLHYQETKDLNSLRRLLHHGSLATTDIYVREMADPADDHSEAVWSALWTA